MGTEALWQLAVSTLRRLGHDQKPNSHVKTVLEERAAAVLHGDGEHLQNTRRALGLQSADKGESLVGVVDDLRDDAVAFIFSLA